jgi:hypothetical protein
MSRSDVMPKKGGAWLDATRRERHKNCVPLGGDKQETQGPEKTAFGRTGTDAEETFRRDQCMSAEARREPA